jgi:predicted esterase
MGVDPRRIGLLGFSAGAITSLNVVLANAEGAKPDFAAIIYDRMVSVTPPPQAPPLFVALVADDPIITYHRYGLVESWREFKRPIELHRTSTEVMDSESMTGANSSDHWIDEFYWWLEADGILKPHVSAAATMVR